ncbi:hypothetical protein [Streptomyces sp. NPDC053720]|uniref:hypothetical protein n=1 Tax=Streptomyces sp. NPDC053720 TaxID=3154855 RepID=UPI0034249767
MPGTAWSVTVPLLQSLTAVAHGGTGTVSTQGDSTTTLYEGEPVTWSVARPDDAALVGLLVIAAVTGTVTVTYTRTVTV